MTLLPAIPVEFLIQKRVHCGMTSYAVAGRIHRCGMCGTEQGDSGEPWELHQPDVTPRRDT